MKGYLDNGDRLACENEPRPFANVRKRRFWKARLSIMVEQSPTSPASNSNAGGIRERVEDALLDLCASKEIYDITVSELCRSAGIGRTTFYNHYGNVREVYDDLVARLIKITTPPPYDALSYPIWQEEEEKPRLCELVRTNPKWKGVVADPHFAQTLSLKVTEMPENNYINNLTERGLTLHQAQTIMLFHFSGCAAIALSPVGQRADFPQCRRTVDLLLRNGIDAMCKSTPIR